MAFESIEIDGPGAPASPPPRPRPAGGGLRLLVWALVGFSCTAAGVGWHRGRQWFFPVEEEIIAVVEAHRDHRVAHPGWSFPARVWSAPVELEPLSRSERGLQAELRGYRTICPPARRGDYCPESGEVELRGGLFPEGPQPGPDGRWTRPLAFEPLRLGTLVGEDGELREHLPLSQAPRHLVGALVASEDEQFEEHAGVDPLGVARAALTNAWGGEVKQGASTLSMQLVRALTGDRERTYDRKVLEMARAVALDRHLGKEAVLQMYLDAPYLGQDGNLSVCGFEAASRYYYNIPAAELSLSQAALLVGILPAPGRYAPDRNPEQARQRRDLVLRRMGDLGWEVESALREPVRVSPTPLLTERFPAYLSAVRVEMESRVAPELLHGAGLDIHTALDPGVQARSESLLRHRAEHMLPGASARAGQSLLIVGAMVDPRDGHLVAAIDPAMADSHGFNRVTQTRRQAGSSYKTVVYAMAMQPGKGGAPRFQPHDSVPNLPRRFGGDKVGWSPRNHGDSYTWRATLGFGLIASQNLATAELLEKLGGAGPLIDFAAQVGFDTSGYRPEMGLGLGQAEVTPVEMARFYASIANGGLLVSGQPVIKAVDADGTVIYEAAPPSARILSEQSTALLRSLLVQVVETSTGRKVRGTSSHAGYKGPVFGKTGTTNDERDLWFVGATPEYSAALWMGFDQLASLGGTAGELAAPTWGAWLNEAYGERSPGEWAGPRLSEQAVCRETGRLPGEFCSVVRLPFAPGQKPLPQCASTHEPIVLDTEGEEAGILGFQPGGPMGAAYPVPQ